MSDHDVSETDGGGFCPLPDRNADPGVRSLLEEARTIAVVGMSPRLGRPSGDVGRYLRDQGFAILPIHPTADEVEGLRTYPDLNAIPAGMNVDVVAVFVSAERAGPVADEAARAGARTIWFQPGAENPEAAERARALGLEVVTGRCMMADHMRLIGPSTAR